MIDAVCTTALLALLFCGGGLQGQTVASSCTECVTWNAPQRPFRIYGNTYWVGPHGLGSVLIISDRGDVLIDGALPESAAVIEANLRTLGVRMRDIKLLVNSHVHYDHAGGLSELQRASGAKVVASEWSAAVLKSGRPNRGDPQFGILPSIQPVAHVHIFHDGQTFHVGSLALTGHSTPGHTPGGTSWTWRSCENGRCLDMVYADSLSPVSADSFKYTQNDTYPNAIQDLQKSFAFLSDAPCDILITPHPQASDFWERVEKHNQGVKPDPLEDPDQCKELVEGAKRVLAARIKTETSH